MNGRLLKYLLMEDSTKSLGINIIMQNFQSKIYKDAFGSLLQKMNEESSNGVELFKLYIELKNQIKNLKDVLQTKIQEKGGEETDKSIDDSSTTAESEEEII